MSPCPKGLVQEAIKTIKEAIATATENRIYYERQLKRFSGWGAKLDLYSQRPGHGTSLSHSTTCVKSRLDPLPSAKTVDFQGVIFNNCYHFLEYHVD